MTPVEIKTLFAMMREYKVFRFKTGDVDISMEMDAPVGATALPVTGEEAKYWSAPPEPKSEDDKIPPTTT